MAEDTPLKPASTASFKEPLISAMLQGLTDQLLAQKMALANRDLATVESIRQGLEALVGQLHKMPPTQLKPHAAACYNIHQLVQQNSQLLAQEHQRVSGMLALFQPGTYEASGQAVIATSTGAQECLA